MSFLEKIKKITLLQFLMTNLARLTTIILFGYLIASIVIALTVTALTKQFKSSFKPNSTTRESVRVAVLRPNVNYMNITDEVEERNLFNSEGKFPERKKKKNNEEKEIKEFDKNADCKNTSIPITLTGTIVIGEKSSLAIVKETGWTEADVYRIGDAIYGNEQAVVHSVSRYEVVLNNDGVKECLKLKKPRSANFGSEGYGDEPPEEAPPEDLTAESVSVTVSSEFVEEQLGPGMANILDKARLVPISKDSFEGFKIFAIKPGSLFQKIKLKNNDMIKKINGTTIQPEQGSMLYEAFQNENEVIIELESGGKPKTITVRIN